MFKYKKLLIIFGSLFVISCSDGNPEITSSGSMSGLSLSNSLRYTLNLLSSFSVSGSCPSELIDLEVSFDKGSSWKKLSEVADSYAINCSSTQNFSANFTPDAGWPSFFTSAALGDKQEMWFRGLSTMQYSDQVRYTIVYSGAASNSDISTIASGELSGSTYKLKASMGALPKALTMTGATYVIQGKVGL